MTRVVQPTGGTTICCGKPMVLQQEKTTDPGKEKHAPVAGKSAKDIIVKLGPVSHPMEEKHFIEFPDIRTENNVFIKGIFPGEKPEAGFCAADADESSGHTVTSTDSE